MCILICVYNPKLTLPMLISVVVILVDELLLLCHCCTAVLGDLTLAFIAPLFPYNQWPPLLKPLMQQHGLQLFADLYYVIT